MQHDSVKRDTLKKIKVRSVYCFSVHCKQDLIEGGVYTFEQRGILDTFLKILNSFYQEVSQMVCIDFCFQSIPIILYLKKLLKNIIEDVFYHEVEILFGCCGTVMVTV